MKTRLMGAIVLAWISIGLTQPVQAKSKDTYSCQNYTQTYGDSSIWYMNIVVPTLNTSERDMMWERLDKAEDSKILMARTRVVDYCSKEENADKNVAKLYFNVISYGYLEL